LDIVRRVRLFDNPKEIQNLLN